MIGYISQAINYYNRNNKYKPRAVSASLFTQNYRFGIRQSDDTKNSAEYCNLPFDLLIDESHELDFDITDHAVENGAVVSDHITQQLRKVQINGMFTNHSINKESSTGDTRTITEIENSPAIENTARNRWITLCKIAKNKQKVRVITSLEVYDEMYIERLSADRGAEDGESVKFSMVLREVRVAKLKSDEQGGEWNPPAPASQSTAATQAMSKKTENGNVSGDATKTAADEATRQMVIGKGGSYT